MASGRALTIFICTYRFFTASIPRKETEFFKELKKGHSSDSTNGKFGWKELPAENSEEDDEEEPEKEFEAEEIIKEDDQKRGKSLSCCYFSFKPRTNGTIRAHQQQSL